MKKRGFGDLEHSILNTLRSKGKRMSVREMQQALGDKDKYTTVMTVMGRLVKKKLLTRDRVGNRYEYWLVKSDENSLFERFKSRLFGLKTVDMVSYLIDEAEDLSSEDLEKVEKMIQNAKKRAAKDE
ncbi:MAG: BlaI/MecI/CopY family transcriptional regulator [Chlamydiales bacterium]|nr:BlaI/MecI/CopY family transcriptional regulator [Chlamydiales bacterium]